jgi:hypothetical protein
LEFNVEEGSYYDYVVRDEVKAKRLKLAKDTLKMVDEHEHFFQIGALVEVKWSDDAVADLLPGILNEYSDKQYTTIPCFTIATNPSVLIAAATV